MCTLSNVASSGGGTPPLHVGFTANVSPGNSPDGGSVNYIQDPTKKWYVMRATYQREKKAYDYLIAAGIECYLPRRRTMKIVNGRRIPMMESLIPGLLFVYTTPEIIHTFAKDTKDLHFLNHYYNHFEMDSYGKNPPLVVDDAAMMNFIKVTSVDNEHVMVVPERLCHYKSGDIVRVIDGDFKGVIGKVARVSGQQRVVVEIKGVCLVSTAYIPSAFIEKI